MTRIVAVVPTFNERANISTLIDRVRNLPVPVEVLVVDDDSPDGTADVVRELAKNDPGVHLLLRKDSPGRGYAGRAGFLRALEMGADAILEMDADLSHDPRHIPDLLAALETHDVALGSRAVSGGSDRDRGWARRALTVMANAFTRRMLRVSVRDCNSGFRAYRREAMERIDPATIQSRGPAIVQEVLYRAASRGLRIAEVPIHFVDRKRGVSTLTFGKLVTGYVVVLKLWALRHLGKV